MPNLTFNTNQSQTTKVPINRNSLFYSEESLLYEMEIGKNYLEQDVNQTVILYQVDLQKTNLDALYNETKPNEVMFKPPVEIHCIYEIEDGDLMSYSKNTNVGTYVKGGKLTFGVYQATLDELKAEIKVGDYIGVQVTPTHREYYTVTNDGRNVFSNKQSIYGVRPLYRKVTCASVDLSEFSGL